MNFLRNFCIYIILYYIYIYIYIYLYKFIIKLIAEYKTTAVETKLTKDLSSTFFFSEWCEQKYDPNGLLLIMFLFQKKRISENQLIFFNNVIKHFSWSSL